ncbi:MAG: PIN domain-containing protein [Nitrospirae bacterium]|nr:MAG: PIN domain-containing protein [Nitrospirota bacterium]
MNIFIDTSGFIAVLDADDDMHVRAKGVWIKMISDRMNFITNNYILVETFALVRSRLGIDAVRALQEDILPLVHVEWVDEISHKMGVSALLAAGRKKLSLVDCVSFETMRKLALKNVFTFDRHFKEQGFKSVV